MFSTKSPARPFPLKQRTSSLDTRRDYSHNTWWSLLVLLKVREFFVTVDNFSIWRRHTAWAMENGKDLRAYMTQRYGSSMVFMSLLLSTQLSILFNSAPVTTHVREALREGRHTSISFWAGFMIITSAILTILSLIALFTAWGMVNSIDEVNTHCIFRSSIGQYAAELPGRLIVCSTYTFLFSFTMFFFLLLPVGPWSITLSALTAFLFLHIVSTFSAFGRIIMHTGAMSNARIFTPEFEDFLLPHSLHANLLLKAQANLANKASIIRQYRRKQQPIDRHLTPETMYDHLSGNPIGSDISDNVPSRPRSDSMVRFAEVKQSSIVPTSSHITTPASDISSNRSTDQPSSLLHERRTPTYSSLRKTSFVGPQRPRPSQPQRQIVEVTSDIEAGPLRSPTVENVSASSLEQWLQNATPSIGEPPFIAISVHDNQPDSDQSRTSTRSKQPIPSHTFALARNSNCAVPSLQRDCNRVSSLRPGMSLDDRNLSEDERFELDYGSFDDKDGHVSPLRTDYGTSDILHKQRFGPPSSECDDKQFSNDEERQALLDHSSSCTDTCTEEIKLPSSILITRCDTTRQAAGKSSSRGHSHPDGLSNGRC